MPEGLEPATPRLERGITALSVLLLFKLEKLEKITLFPD